MIKDIILRVLRRRADPVMLLKRIASPHLELRTLVHVGAHLAQEREKYEACGYRDILWIEGSPDIHDRLAKIIAKHTETGMAGATQHRTFCALLTDRDDGHAELSEFSNDGGSNSIFRPTIESFRRWRHVRETGRRHSVTTRTLDGVISETGYMGRVDVLVADVQGAELLVVRGAEKTLATVKAVIVEVSTVPYYDGGVLYPELKEFLFQQGFVPMSIPRRHGDMLFLRRQ